MYRTLIALVLLFVGLPALAVPIDPTDRGPNKKNQSGASGTPTQQYQELLHEYMSAFAQAPGRAGRGGPKPADKNAKKLPKPHALDARFLRLALHYPKDPVAVDALIWVANHGDTQQVNQAIDLLAERYAKKVKVGAVLYRVVRMDSPAAETLLTALQSAPALDTQARAHLWRADHLRREADQVERLKGGNGPALAKELTAAVGEDEVKRLKGMNPDKLRKSAEKLYEQTAKTYPDVRMLPGKGTFADAARAGLFELRHLRIGQPAPDLEGDDQLAGSPFKLRAERGKEVVLLFSNAGIEGCRDIDPDVKAVREGAGNARTVIAVSGIREKTDSQWNVQAWPTMYLIDAKGVIRDKRIGARETGALLKELLKK
jgi:hypothetical protein